MEPKKNQKVIRVDIDETICYTPKSRDYSKAKPIPLNIDIVNRYYDDGHYIIYWTSRGTKTGKDWKELTENQLKEWGAKYHSLELKKPYYDILICDKALNSERHWTDELVNTILYKDE